MKVYIITKTGEKILSKIKSLNHAVTNQAFIRDDDNCHTYYFKDFTFLNDCIVSCYQNADLMLSSVCIKLYTNNITLGRSLIKKQSEV